MTKDDFLVAIKLATGIEIKLEHEYYFGNKISVIRPVKFMEDGIIYEYKHYGYLRITPDTKTASCSYDQLMGCVNDIREIFPHKIHSVHSVEMIKPNQYFKTVI